MQLQRDYNIMREQLGALQNIYASKVARVRVMSHCCLGRIHQILISIIPYITMSPGEHHEVSRLIYELLRAPQCLQFQDEDV